MSEEIESDVYVRMEPEIVEHYALITQAELATLHADLASATATIAEQPHRADANEGEALAWRERCESAEAKAAEWQFSSEQWKAAIDTAVELNRTERAARLAAQAQEAHLRRFMGILVHHIPTDLYWPEGQMTWFDALCGALGILKVDRVDAALATPANGAGDVLMAAKDDDDDGDRRYRDMDDEDDV